MRTILTDIANELHAFRTGLGTTFGFILDFDELISNRELELTPETGWEGKNAEARTFSKDSALASDNLLQEYKEERKRLEKDRITAEHAIKALEDKRRAYEYYIRFLQASNETEENR